MQIPPIFRFVLLVPWLFVGSGCEDPEEGVGGLDDGGASEADDDSTADEGESGEGEDSEDSGDAAEESEDEGGSSDDGDSDEDSGSDGGSDDSDDGSEGCGEDYPDKGGVTLTVSVNGVEREFIFVVPQGYDPDRQYPLVFGMHGLNGSGDVFRSYASIEPQTAGNAIHVYPSAVEGSWDLMPGGADFTFFDEIVDFATSTVCIDIDRIFSYGHSFGGYYSNALGCHRGDVLRAIGPIAGGGPGWGATTNCVGSVAAILMHGTDDMTVNISAGQMSRDHWLQANGCSDVSEPIELAPCVEYQGCDSGLPVVWCEHTGIGHNVPWGGWQGTIDYGPQAMWDFFSRF